MAGRKIGINATAITLGTGLQNQILIRAGTNTPIKINRIEFGPKGTSNADPRIDYVIYTKPSIATPGASPATVDQIGGHSKGTGALQTTASVKPTAENLTSARVAKRGTFLPNGPYACSLTLDVNAGEDVLIQTNVSTSQVVDFSAEGEE